MRGLAERGNLIGQAQADLRVNLLGPPKLEWKSHPLNLPRRQVRMLFYYLAIEQYPVPYERLRFLIWPDKPDESSRRYLSHLLTHLRQALPAPDILVTRGSQATLCPHKVWSDVVTFRRLVMAPPGSNRLAGLGQAVALYRGTLLDGVDLPIGLEFESIIAQERSSLEHLYLNALLTLINEEMTLGNYDSAIEYAQSYLSIDELNEKIHRRLIKLYAITRDRVSAMKQFRRCAQILDRELGISPMPETQAIYQDAVEGRLNRAQMPVTKPIAFALSSSDVPVVGRADLLSDLIQVAESARRGQGGVALISGEAGSGMSRILQECMLRFRDEAFILTGNCHPGAQSIPYHTVAQLLRQLLQLEPTAIEFDTAFLAAATRLLPELRNLGLDDTEPAPADIDDVRIGFFPTLCDIFLGLASGPCGVILCLDDLHWADRASLDWLSYLASQLEGKRLLVLGTYCCKAEGALGEFVNRLAQLGAYYGEFKLHGLDTPAVLELLRRLYGTVPGDNQLAARLQEVTGGNPLFLLEVIRSFNESGLKPGDLVKHHDVPLPDTVWKAVKTRLDHLSPIARQVIEVAAIIGYEFRFEQIRWTAGLSEMQTIDALDELVHRRLLVDQEGSYYFQHDLVRQMVRMNLSPTRRQVLERRATRPEGQIDSRYVLLPER